MVGRTGHSAKTKARRGREIDVLIFPIQAAGSGLFCAEKGHAGKMCSLLFPFRRLLFGRAEGPQPGGFGAAGLEVQAAGRRACERTGLYCYKFHHLFQMREMDGRVLEWRGERLGRRGWVDRGGLLFGFNGVISALREFYSHSSDQGKPARKKPAETQIFSILKSQTRAERRDTQPGLLIIRIIMMISSNVDKHRQEEKA